MPFHFHARESWAIGVSVVRWLLLSFPLGVMVGSACAFFLWSLDLVTRWRLQSPGILWLLPLGGAAVGLLYSRLGQSVEAGNNLIVDEIHAPGGGVPLRMAPLVLAGTLITHLFGGSAGREGTAVQMGGSLASGLTKVIPGLTSDDTRTLLMAGIAAGFGGVFGTPVAGMIFALEVLAIGRLNYSAILPCLIASIVSDQTCAQWGIGHLHYSVTSMSTVSMGGHLAPVQPVLMSLVAISGVIFGLTSILFAELTHGLHVLFKRLIPSPILRPATGGLVVIGLVLLLGTRDYLGLGVSSPDPEAVTIVKAFQANGVDFWSWWWKIAFTAITLSSGFKGGEVTPLFFVGACLGNTLAMIFGTPVDLFAALGFVAVFAGATNTPIACTVMAIELFGGEYSTYFAVSCVMAYLFSGHSGIYLSQRIGMPKVQNHALPPDSTLRIARSAKPSLTGWYWHKGKQAGATSQSESQQPESQRPESSQSGS